MVTVTTGLVVVCVTEVVVAGMVWVADTVVCGIVVGVSVRVAGSVVRGMVGVRVIRGVMGTSTSPGGRRDVWLGVIVTFTGVSGAWL
jgi:hypothetical protein